MQLQNLSKEKFKSLPCI